MGMAEPRVVIIGAGMSVYSPGPEIRAYLERVATRFGVRERVVFGTEVLSARFADGDGRWHVTTSAGTTDVADFRIH